MNSNRIISIEGNIGSGKSTLLEELKHHLGNRFSGINIIFLPEPVDDWSSITDENDTQILKLFYNDTAKYAFSFQIMAYISRLALLKKTINENSNSIIITERSLFTDKFVFAKMLYDNKDISEVDYKIYLKWFDVFATDFPIDKVIYVKTSPTVCLSRVNTRSRDGESSISLDYLTSCHDYHEKMLEQTKDCFCKKQLIINGDDDINQNITIMLDRFKLIEDFLFKPKSPSSPAISTSSSIFSFSYDSERGIPSPSRIKSYKSFNSFNSLQSLSEKFGEENV